MEKFLSISGFGDVYEEHFESGIVLARDYFAEQNLNFLECHAAYIKNQNSELGIHWQKAEGKANLALYGFNLQGNSMLELEIVDEEIY